MSKHVFKLIQFLNKSIVFNRNVLKVAPCWFSRVTLAQRGKMEEVDILCSMKDAHYFQLNSQGNVYTLTSLNLANGTNKILAASLKREVFCFEYPDNISDILTPTQKEVLFTYIPGVAEIISIDAFNKSDTENDFVIGITITKNSNDQPRENYLNIYSAWEATTDFNLESIAQNCLSLELNFIPYHLYHTNLLTWNENGEFRSEIVWLLSGSDEKIHLFQEVASNHTFREVELMDHFPELASPPSIVMWTDVQYYNNNSRRITAYGCECGFVKLSIVNTKTLEILENHTLIYENTISSVRLFRIDSVLDNSLVEKQTPKDEFHLLIVNTIIPSVVCRDVLEKGLTDQQDLESSDFFNVASCCCVADIDFDGENEILIGTYGQEVLAYKQKDNSWQLKGIRTIAHPVYAIRYMDVTGDGVNEIVVLSIKGVQILQHDQNEIEKIIEEKLKLI